MRTKCVVCGREERSKLIDKDMHLFNCSHCTHTFTLDDRDDADIYSDEYYTEEHKNWTNNPFFWLFERVNDSLSLIYGARKFKLLDVGCGKGDFLAYTRQVNPHISLSGIDLYDGHIDGIDFIKGDFLKKDIGKKFDVVCSFLMMEHVKDPVLFIRKIREALISGGLVYITTVNNNSLFFRIARFLNSLGVKSAYKRLYSIHHLQHYTNRSLAYLLESYGFRIVSQENHNYAARAVDMPEGSVIVKMMYAMAIRIIFVFSALFRSGILQTVIAKKEDSQKSSD